MLFYGVGIVGSSFVPNLFRFFSGFMNISLFWIGFKIRQYGSDILRKIPALIWIFEDVAGFALIQLLHFPQGIIFTLFKVGLDFVLHILGAIMSFVVLQELADCINWQKNRFFCTISKSSFAVFLFHQQVIYIFIHILNGTLNPYLNAAVNFFGAMIISLLISAFMMKFRVTKVLIGEK